MKCRTTVDGRNDNATRSGDWYIKISAKIYLLTFIQKSTLGQYICKHISKDEKIQHFVKLKAFNNNKCKQARAKYCFTYR